MQQKLRDDYSPSIEIISASRGMSDLHSLWKSNEVQCHSKPMIFAVTLASLVLLGRKS